MTIKHTLTLRNLLILFCIAMLVLIGLKGIDINRKMAWVDEAGRYYDQKDLIAAEEWYQKASNNNSIHYKEDLIAKRLLELQPITLMKQTLSQLDQRAERTGSGQDFTGFLQVYNELQSAQSKYMNTGDRFAAYYPKISAGFGISDDITRYFQQFKALFYSQLDDRLSQGQTDEATPKWNLQAIPDVFYGGANEKTKQLTAKFKDFDEKLMSKLAGEGKFPELLDVSQSMMSQYQGRKLTAPWVKTKAEELARIILKKDVEGNQPANYALHAKAYEAYAKSAGIKSSLLSEIDRQIRKWITAAQRKVKNNDFEGAIAIYEALSSYQDTTNEIKKAKLAWTVHDPLRLLQQTDQTKNYSHVSGGGNRFGGSAYAIGSDDSNTVYFAKMNDDESVQILSTHDFPSNINIRQISVEKSLSTKAAPVILVEGDSNSRNALYAAYEVHDGGMTQLFLFDADSYEVQADRSLLVAHPNGVEGDGGTSQNAIYMRQGDSYQFMGYQKDYTDINVNDLLSHSNEKIRFTCYIVYGGEGDALAQMGDSYVKLHGNYSFYDGMNVTVTGLFSQFEDVYPGGDQLGELISVPVVDVENME
ncbi:hypothetical protein J23TS9_35490 [Paenibacillus sp. J23TS9]|uniref:hypothetical protein n=1 Tax=Paenibacillus sp. J23TS9 TaxID=2807193 RepID=UPI001B1DAB43|nr:hypothetical protein [Paenibacillus sp. J23TS9]GIP28419.1 hypothetical protein J23TS9_35490 [Paenibacillus sp. J23TS9]